MNPDAEELRSLMGFYAGEVERCIRCGFCNSVCPTSNIEQSFKDSHKSRGRLVMLQSILWNSSNLSPFSNKFLELIDLCFGCRRCLVVCPASIPIPQIMWHVRYAAERRKANPTPYTLRAFLVNYDKIAKAASSLSTLSSRLINSSLGRGMASKLLGLHKDVKLPPYRPLKKTKRRRVKEEADRLVFFGDVFPLYHEGDTTRRFLDKLEEMGFEVVIPKQRQAGIPLLEAGLIDEARKIAEYNVSILTSYVSEGYKILTLSPAAYLALKKDYITLIGSRAEEVAEKTIDATQLANQLLKIGMVKPQNLRNQPIVYHSSCFSQATGLSSVIVEMLQNIGCSIMLSTPRCCGVAGMWGLLRKNYEKAIAVGEPLFNELRNVSVAIVSQSETCRLWLRNNLERDDVKHPIEIFLERTA